MMLSDLQNQFQNYLVYGDTEITSCINNKTNISVDTRLSIYKNAYQARLIDALTANYPILNQYLGYEQFNELGELYLKNYSSTFRSIRWFGDKLTVFLRDTQPYTSMPYLSELAQFEWVNTLVFDAAESSLLQVEDVSKISPENWPDMILLPHPSLHCLTLQWNVVQIWQAMHEKQLPPELELYTDQVSWVLWRKELTNQFSSVPEDEMWAINSVLQGYTFGDICEGLCQWVSEEQAGLHAASLLKGWIQSGLLSALKF